MSDFGYDELLRDFDFVWSGNTYKCAKGDRRDSKQAGPGGFSVDYDQVIVCGKLQFGTTLPSEKEQVTVDGVAYRIETITHDPNDEFMVLNLQDASRGV